MQILTFGNNASGTLAEDITAEQTTIELLQGEGEQFRQLLSTEYQNPVVPLAYYAKLTLTNSQQSAHEIVHLTGVTNDTLTVVRGRELTTARGWELNDFIGNLPTRGSENEFVQIGHQQSGFYLCGRAGGTANGLTLNLPSGQLKNGGSEWELNAPFVVLPTQENTAAATLQITLGDTTIGTFPLYKGERDELDAGDILQGVPLLCLLNKTDGYVSVINPSQIYDVLGTAAFRDVTTSRTDRTAGRLPTVLEVVGVNGAVARANGGTVTDCNNLPENSVSFVYNDADNSPGFVGSLLDFAGLGSGYRVQFCAEYNGTRVAIRRFNNDSAKSWSEWVQFYTPKNPPTAAAVGAVPTARRINNYPLTKDVTITSKDIYQQYQSLVQANLNDISTPGLYAQKNNENATAARNYPIAYAGSLEVLEGADRSGNVDGVIQVYRTYNNAGIYQRSLTSGGWTGWIRFFTQNFFPTAGQVGAIPLSGSQNISGTLRTSGQFQSTTADGLRIIQPARGVIVRNDSSNFYILITNQNDPYGGWNNLRPIRIQLDNGFVELGHNVQVDGNFQVNGGINANGNVSGNRLTPRDYGNFDQRYLTSGSVNQNYIRSMRFGAKQDFRERSGAERQGGGVMTSWADFGKSNYHIYTRALQYLINNQWVTTPYTDA